MMSPEWLTAIASAGTFIVIAASAIAAFGQLRHVRGNNQIVVLTEIRRTMDTSEFREALRFVQDELPRRLGEPAFRRALLNRASAEFQPVRRVANFFETAAALVKHGLVDRDLACDLWAAPVIRSWDSLAPLTASLRAKLGYRLWEDFEYLSILCKKFWTDNPAGTFPASMNRAPLPEAWPEATESSPEHVT